MSLNPDLVVYSIKVMGIGMVGLLAYLCQTDPKRRDDPRLFGEFSLVVLTMLIVSERSWKHHYVTVLLPYTFLVFRLWAFQAPQGVRSFLGGCIGLSALLMLSTSSEVGGLFASGTGHKRALFYGMFFWSGVALYIGTAFVVFRERRYPPITDESGSALFGATASPHFASLASRRHREPHRPDDSNASPVG